MDAHVPEFDMLDFGSCRSGTTAKMIHHESCFAESGIARPAVENDNTIDLTGLEGMVIVFVFVGGDAFAWILNFRQSEQLVEFQQNGHVTFGRVLLAQKGFFAGRFAVGDCQPQFGIRSDGCRGTGVDPIAVGADAFLDDEMTVHGFWSG